jgi:hypothetical protein
MDNQQWLAKHGLPELGTAKRLLDKCYKALNKLEFLEKSGSVFLSTEASLKQSKVLFLGLNPGGDDADESYGTILASMISCRLGVSGLDQDWSTSSRSYFPGDSVFQRRFKHIAERLGIAYGAIPATNLSFIRTRDVGSYDGFHEDIVRFGDIHALILDEIQPEYLWITGQTKYARSLLDDSKMKWRSSGHGNGFIGRGRGMFCDREVKVCHTPHLSRWDPQTNAKALEWSFEGLI